MANPLTGYNFAYLDEQTKRMIRRAILKAVAIPGYQVPFGGREMPMPYGWGTGGIQITASVIGEADVLKVIDHELANTPWLAGGEPTIADVAAYSYIALRDAIVRPTRRQIKHVAVTEQRLGAVGFHEGVPYLVERSLHDEADGHA